jgi:hypothetical protein
VVGLFNRKHLLELHSPPIVSTFRIFCEISCLVTDSPRLQCLHGSCVFLHEVFHRILWHNVYMLMMIN